jgi:hypothetical protein
MAHANNSIITGKFKGSLGKELVFREWQGKTVVAKSPKYQNFLTGICPVGTSKRFTNTGCKFKAIPIVSYKSCRRLKDGQLYVSN